MELHDEGRLLKRQTIGKQMCDTAEDVLKLSEIETFCETLKEAIKTWHKGETLGKMAAFEDVTKAGNELYLLLSYAVENFTLDEETARRVTSCMSAWFNLLSDKEAKDLSPYVLQPPYHFE